MTLTRRDSLFTIGAAVASLTLTNEAAAAADGGVTISPDVAANAPAAKPLPFNPAKLKGLSEKLIKSHHENNYGGAVKNLGLVRAQLSQTTKATPAFVVGGLKERELTFFNSMVLHEQYFGNLGGDGKPGGKAHALLSSASGGFARWEEQFRATGAALGGGSGWVVVDHNLYTGETRTFWSGNHTQTSAMSVPLIVMDMYEHAYQMDYGAAAAKYIDAFFQNLNWDEVNRRVEAAQRARVALLG